MTRLAVAAALGIAVTAAAAQQPGRPSSPGLRVTLLGTAGGPPAHVDRSQPATLLRVGGRAYLIDAGENAGQQLLRAGVPTSRVDAAFLTHLHWDHALGLGYLMATGWMLGRTTPMPIVGPPGTTGFVEREIGALGVGEELFRAATPDRPALKALYPVREAARERPAVIYSDATVKVTAVANSHFTAVPLVAGARVVARSYSYRFDTAQGSVVFTGDTGPSRAVTELAHGADLLVTEICDVDSIRAAMVAIQPSADLNALVRHMQEEHLSPEEVGRMAAAAGVRKVVLTHYVMGQRYDPSGFIRRIAPFYKGEIVAGHDLESVDLPPR